MAKKSFVDEKCRTGIPGVPGLGKVVNEEAWGAAKAVERYGGGMKTFPPPKDASFPQFKPDQRGPGWEDDTSGWVRGAGGDATKRSGYVAGYRSKGK
jgi:hypothetical protein